MESKPAPEPEPVPEPEAEVDDDGEAIEGKEEDELGSDAGDDAIIASVPPKPRGQFMPTSVSLSLNGVDFVPRKAIFRYYKEPVVSSALPNRVPGNMPASILLFGENFFDAGNAMAVRLRGQSSDRVFECAARFVVEEVPRDEDEEDDDEDAPPRPTLEGIRFELPEIAPPDAEDEDGEGKGEGEGEGEDGDEDKEADEEEDAEEAEPPVPPPEMFAVELTFNGQQYSVNDACIEIFFGPDEDEEEEQNTKKKKKKK